MMYETRERSNTAQREESNEEGRQGSPPRTPDTGATRRRPGSPEGRRRARTADSGSFRRGGSSSPHGKESMIIAGAAAGTGASIGVPPPQAASSESRSGSPDRVDL